MNQNHPQILTYVATIFFFVFYHVLILTFPPGQSGWGVATHTGAGHAEDVLGVDLPPLRVARDRRHLRRIYKHVS